MSKKLLSIQTDVCIHCENELVHGLSISPSLHHSVTRSGDHLIFLYIYRTLDLGFRGFWSQKQSVLIKNAHIKVTSIAMESHNSKLLNSKKPSLVNKILWWPGSLYTINHMLNSKNLTIVKKFGDKTEFTIARFHCTKIRSIYHWNDHSLSHATHKILNS